MLSPTVTAQAHVKTEHMLNASLLSLLLTTSMVGPANAGFALAKSTQHLSLWFIPYVSVVHPICLCGSSTAPLARIYYLLSIYHLLLLIYITCHASILATAERKSLLYGATTCSNTSACTITGLRTHLNAHLELQRHGPLVQINCH